MRAGNAKPVTVPSERLTTSPMLVTGSGLWSLFHAKFVIVPSQDRLRIVASAPGRSNDSSAINVILMTLDILVFIGAIREHRTNAVAVPHNDQCAVSRFSRNSP